MATPQHRQLAESLIAQISDGTLSVGDRLPTELELCESNGLARGTVRRALEQVEALGMISRRRRAGTIVTSPVPVDRYQPLAKSAADVAALSSETRLVEPRIGEIHLDASLAERIGARKGSKWFEIVGSRVDRRGGQPLCWSEHYVRSDVSRESLLRGILTEEEVAQVRNEQCIYADSLTQEAAEALDGIPGKPALVISRRAFDARGRLLSIGIHTHRADRYRITTGF
jgi:GntR family transcriptional regulator